MREMAADETTTGWAATLETGPETPGDGVQEHGDRATVVDSCRVSWRPPFTQRPRGAGPVWTTASRTSGGRRSVATAADGGCGRSFSRRGVAPTRGAVPLR